MQAQARGGREQAAAAAAAVGLQPFGPAAELNGMCELVALLPGRPHGWEAAGPHKEAARAPLATHLTICPTTSPPFDMAAPPLLAPLPGAFV